MRATDIKEISTLKDRISLLKDKKNIIAMSVSLASGLAWKNKVCAFYEVIARELLEIFDKKLLNNVVLDKINTNFSKLYISNQIIYFSRNNLFLDSYEKIKIDDWLKQTLLIIESKSLPSYLTSYEKEEIFQYIKEEEMDIINRNYNKQELNSDKFMLDLDENDISDLIKILTKANYFSLSVYDYLKMIAQNNYSYELDYIKDKELKYFKNTYNNYILELGSYIAKVLEEYLEQNSGSVEII